MADELRKLQEVLDAGFIDEREFNRRKAEILQNNPGLACQSSDNGEQSSEPTNLYSSQPTNSSLYEPNSAYNTPSYLQSSGSYQFESPSTSLYSYSTHDSNNTSSSLYPTGSYGVPQSDLRNSTSYDIPQTDDLRSSNSYDIPTEPEDSHSSLYPSGSYSIPQEMNLRNSYDIPQTDDLRSSNSYDIPIETPQVIPQTDYSLRSSSSAYDIPADDSSTSLYNFSSGVENVSHQMGQSSSGSSSLLNMVKQSYEDANLDESVRNDILENLENFFKTIQLCDISGILAKNTLKSQSIEEQKKSFSIGKELLSQALGKLKHVTPPVEWKQSYYNYGSTGVVGGAAQKYDDSLSFTYISVGEKTTSRANIWDWVNENQKAVQESVSEYLSSSRIFDRDDLCLNYQANLHHIPAVLFSDSWNTLVNLEMKQCDLVDIPAEIANLTRLRFLNLSWNHIKTICPEIEQCKQLRVVDFSYNSIKVVQRSFFAALTELKKVNLFYNPLETVEDEDYKEYIDKNSSTKYTATSTMPHTIAHSHYALFPPIYGSGGSGYTGLENPGVPKSSWSAMPVQSSHEKIKPSARMQEKQQLLIQQIEASSMTNKHSTHSVVEQSPWSYLHTQKVIDFWGC